jgi:hypothetical protein
MGPLGLELRFLSESSEEFLVSSALPATPWSLALVEVEPAWALDCCSGSGDWRPWLGADIFEVCVRFGGLEVCEGDVRWGICYGVGVGCVRLVSCEGRMLVLVVVIEVVWLSELDARVRW